MSIVQAEDYHVPVMLQECLEGMQLRPEGCYVDVTFGESIPFHNSDNRKRLATDIAGAIRSMLAFSLRGGWRK